MQSSIKNYKGYFIILFIIILIIIIFMIQFKLEPSEDDFKVVKLNVSGMTCQKCERSVKKTVKRLKGIDTVEIDYESGNGYVKFNKTKTSQSEILKILELSGYLSEIRKPVKAKLIDYNVRFKTK